MTVERIFLAKAEMKDNIQIRATASYCAIYIKYYNVLRTRFRSTA